MSRALLILRPSKNRFLPVRWQLADKTDFLVAESWRLIPYWFLGNYLDDGGC